METGFGILYALSRGEDGQLIFPDKKKDIVPPHAAVCDPCWDLFKRLGSDFVLDLCEKDREKQEVIYTYATGSSSGRSVLGGISWMGMMADSRSYIHVRKDLVKMRLPKLEAAIQCGFWEKRAMAEKIAWVATFDKFKGKKLLSLGDELVFEGEPTDRFTVKLYCSKHCLKPCKHGLHVYARKPRSGKCEIKDCVGLELEYVESNIYNIPYFDLNFSDGTVLCYSVDHADHEGCRSCAHALKVKDKVLLFGCDIPADF